MRNNHEDPDDNLLRYELDLIKSILGDLLRPEIILERALLEYDKTYIGHLKNKDRAKNTEPKKSRQPAHRPRLTRREIFHRLILRKLEKEEKKQEAQVHGLTHIDGIKRLCKHLDMYMLTHTSHDAVVAVCEILCTYTAKEAARIYAVIAYNRALKKYPSQYSRIKKALMKSASSRFAPHEIFRETDTHKLHPSDWRVLLTAQKLAGYMPDRNGIPEVQWEGDRPLFEYDKEDPHGDSDIEVARMHIICSIKYFDRIARSVNLNPFKESVRNLKNWWPLPPDASIGAKREGGNGNDGDSSNEGSREGNEGGNGSDVGQYDLKEIRNRVASQRQRRDRISPGSLSIRVDEIECATLRGSKDRRKIVFEADATMVDIVGRDNEGDVVLATYILTYDNQARREEWEIELPGSQKLQCTFHYDKENRVRAKFNLTSARMESALSPAWHKAQIVLNFAGLLIFLAVLLALFIYSNWALNPRFAAGLAPKAAEVIPVLAINRVVSIWWDGSLDSQIRSDAARSHWKIQDQFQIAEPSNGSTVDVRQIVRGTTPFPGMRHYIIVTTPQNVDYVSSEARVSGNSWQGIATFGSAGAGGGEKFQLRVIATKARLAEGPYSTTADEFSSNSIQVIRR